MNSSIGPDGPAAPGALLKVASCLVLGGARSGKSAYALALAEQSTCACIYLATGAAWDDEMRARISRHQAERGERWQTVEEPVSLAEALHRFSARGTVVVVDCLTLWLTNLMLGDHDVKAATDALLRVLPTLGSPTIFVSNEVGSGIVPDNALAREFRDEQGRLNQALAQACESVVLVTAGLPSVLKPTVQPRLTIKAAEPP